jgi:poly(A) polymerase
MTERTFATEVVRTLHAAGYQALWAGGCVRDELLSLSPHDYDVATDARPEQVQALFKRTVAVGMSFGVVEVIGPRVDSGRLKVQVATFRSDGSYSDGRHPDEVVFSTAREDALRRDFTINGMFFDPLANQLIDHVGGQADLQARVLRAIGEPAQRFQEDKLRLLRAVRFAARFELALDPATAAAVRSMAAEIRVVSAERIADEFRKMLVLPHRARGMRLLDEVGLLAVLLPELVSMKGLPQGLPSAPTGDLWEHTLQVLGLLGTDVSFPLALAALLHDVGKPRTVARTPDRYTFYQHEHVGRRLASDIALRLKLSNDEREAVEWLVEKHQYLSDARKMRPSKLKPTFVHEHIQDLFALHRADALSSGHNVDHVDYCEKLRNKWAEEGKLDPPPLLTGNDLLAMDLEQGPLFKKLLAAVREAQLDGTITTTEEAKALVERLLNEKEEAD